jgi:protein-disulfide isomerase
VSEARRSPLWPAIAGGLVGSAVTALALILAAPDLVGSRIVRVGLMSDPQVLLEADQALRDLQLATVLKANRTALETPFASSWKGAAEPDAVLVEFFDYACPYCKVSNPHVDRLLREDKGLRVVYREFPILGPDSVAAARVSLAASRAGRFRQYHDALFSVGKPSPSTITRAASAAGVQPNVPEDSQAEAEIRRNLELASQLGATGTPMFIVGDRVLNGAVGYETLKKAIADARAKS